MTSLHFTFQWLEVCDCPLATVHNNSKCYYRSLSMKAENLMGLFALHISFILYRKKIFP